MSDSLNQKKDNQSTIQRCPHDRKNPYVMLNLEFIESDLSPQAKGMLTYILSRPSNWQISHSQLARALNCGEKYVRSMLNELIEKGYVTIEVGGDNINEYKVRFYND